MNPLSESRLRLQRDIDLQRMVSKVRAGTSRCVACGSRVDIDQEFWGNLRNGIVKCEKCWRTEVLAEGKKE